jgi:predicted enzyme related to lactoylglutathione lyase
MRYAEFIIYVADQQASRLFYHAVLGCAPRLDVPGMTEFDLNAGAVLGLMPAAGIKRLLGTAIPDPQSAHGIPRCELYLPADDPQAMLDRVVAAGGRVLSPPALRNWGEIVAYAADPDGHVLAFSTPPPPETTPRTQTNA